MGTPGMTELLIVLAIVVLIFGGSKLPAMGRQMGEAISGFKKGIAKKAEENDDTPENGDEV